MAQALTEKQDTERAIKILKRAQDVITKHSGPEFAQQPLLKSSLKRLQAQDEEVLKLQAQYIRQRQAELREAERKEKLQRARESIVSSPKMTDIEEEKEFVDSQPVCSAVEETPAPLPRESSPNGSTLDSNVHGHANESMTEIASLSKQNSVIDDFDEEAKLAWFHTMRALPGVLTAILVVSFAARSRRR